MLLHYEIELLRANVYGFFKTNKDTSGKIGISKTSGYKANLCVVYFNALRIIIFIGKTYKLSKILILLASETLRHIIIYQ